MRHPSVRFATACLGTILVAVALPAAAAITDFTGSWSNADQATRGLTQVDIRTDNGQLIVHAAGKCHPRDCDWGEASAQLFTPNVGVPVETGLDAAIVQFDFGGAQTMLLLQTSTNGLSFKTFTIFASGERSNYHGSGHLERR